MKRVLLCLAVSLMLVTGCTTAKNAGSQNTDAQNSEAKTTEVQNTVVQNTEAQSVAMENLNVDMEHLLPIKYSRPETPDAEQLSIIRYILKHTEEINIHRMRGETENQVYVNEDGREAVYDKDGNLVTNSYNQGTYNFYSNETEPIKKFIYDIALWLRYGINEDDPTTFEERLYHYTLDLDIGIQNYIFFGSDETLEVVSFDALSEREKEVYYIFLELLFSDSYSAKLSRDNIQQMRDDGEFYFQYFDQIQEALNILPDDTEDS